MRDASDLAIVASAQQTRGTVTQASLRWLLAVLGVLLEQAGRYSNTFRRQVTRDVVVEITTSDGVAHHYVFTCGNRSVMSVRGPAERSTVSLWFADAGQAFWWLLSPQVRQPGLLGSAQNAQWSMAS